MSDLHRQAKEIKDVFKRDNIFPGPMGGAQIDSDYPYGDALARSNRVSMQQPISKSWLFEVADRETGEIDESFTLILPPQSYTIREPQRVAITKTFGNAFVDDYGPDNIEITLKGISGTVHVFPTYSTDGGTKEFTDVSLVAEELQEPLDGPGMDGRNAFYYFRNRIMRYKDKADWDKRELRVYDIADEQAYRCVLLDFTLDRTSEKPLHYPFTISLFVYERLDKFKPVLKPINIAEDPVAALDKADAIIEKTQALYRGIQTVTDASSMIKARSLELRTRWNRAAATRGRLLRSPLEAARNFIDTQFALIGIAYDTWKAGKYTFDRYMGALEMARDALNNGLRVYGFQISEGRQRSQRLSYDVDKGVDPDGGATGTSSPAAAGAVSRKSTPKDYTFSGLRLYTVRGQDTLSSIALHELGDDELWPFIADANPGIAGSDDLVSGEQIFIPVQVDSSDVSPKERFIFSEDPTRDPYGTDIRLDSSGNLIFQSNDFEMISGIHNVQQAIDLRINTEVGSMIKQSAYGITAQAGFAGSSMAIRYLKMALRSTIIQDPRVESIDDMLVSVGGDVIRVSMTITVVGYEGSIPVPLEL